MQVHNLLKSGNKKAKRIGRGGKRGSYSGRGIKGQKSRAGRRIRPQIRDIIKKIHKRRGYGRNRSRSTNPEHLKPQAVNLGALDRTFKDGEKVTVELLMKRGLIKSNRPVKVLGGGLPAGKAGKPAHPAGGLTKKLSFDKNLLMSESVKKICGTNLN